MKVVWHEVPGRLARSAWKQKKSGPVAEGRLICSLVPEIFLVELYLVRF